MLKRLTKYLPYILFVLVVTLISCSSNKQEDKYPLITKSDRAAIDSVCRCTRPVVRFMNTYIDSFKSQTFKDSPAGKMIMDSVTAIGKTIDSSCGKSIEKSLRGLKNNKEYQKQFIAYLTDNNIECKVLFLGVSGEVKENK